MKIAGQRDRYEVNETAMTDFTEQLRKDNRKLWNNCTGLQLFCGFGRKKMDHTTAGRSADRTGAAGWWDGRNNRC